MSNITTNTNDLDRTIDRTAAAIKAERLLAAQHGYRVEFEDVSGDPDSIRPFWV